MKKAGLFIGVNEYNDKSLSNLSFAVNDATAASEAFKKLGFETTLISGNEFGNVTRKVGELCSKLGPKDIFVLYFAGHGIEEKAEHLLLGPNADSELFGESSCNDVISLEAINIKAKKKNKGPRRLFIFDCCRNSLSRGVALEKPPVIEDAGLCVIRSCSAGEYAYADPETQHGLFTTSLMNALNISSDSFYQFIENVRFGVDRNDQNVDIFCGQGVNLPLKQEWEAEKQFALAQTFRKERNHAAAIPHYLNAAVQNHPEAQYKLGKCYYSGSGCEQNYSLALEWFKRAAENNYPDAQFALAYCLYRGRGITEPDYKNAAEWYRKAAEKGNLNAKYNLALCFEEGYGVSVNLQRAAELYREAAGKGHEKSRAALEKLSNRES